MHKNIVLEFEKRLKSIVTYASDDLTAGLEMHDGVYYSLPQNQKLLLSELIKNLIEKTKSEERFSEKAVGIKIKKIFAQMYVEPTKSYKSEIEALAIELESYDTSTTVHMRVVGLFVCEEMNLGNVAFRMCNESYLDDILAPVLFDSDGIKSQRASDFEAFFRPNIRKDLGTGCVARVTLVAEPIRAFERAKDEIRRVIDILRYACTNDHFAEDIRIGLVGDYPRSERFGYVFQGNAFSSKSDMVGSRRRYALDKNALENMEQIGALKLAGFLEKSSMSPFQECLIRAVHWYSSGVTQSEKENGYLHLMIALEALFTPEKGDPIANTIAESTALIINNTLAGRKQLKKFVKQCYATRSSIAHGGKKAVSDFDLKRLMIIVSNVISSLAHIEDRFSKREDLFAYLEDLKFSPQ
ncbi:HEPN domain-containing protein [Pseudomonas fragariae (ex Marin et al. 2024)]|uniref:HEPN domain-containing protein n=1 Tax=Pseudomonas TaxID=286 RepID=UPI000451C0E8|nr:HEPN domain-containing protein [Pseudomonas syringae]AKF43661.1 hypothetical protein PsyrB_00540 [Pseudomonas syringae pv. syringae B301D]EXL29163.1 hypothetical protein PssB301D_04660 [Pseudomonas syringae pv. syringae str. B301D-R]